MKLFLINLLNVVRTGNRAFSIVTKRNSFAREEVKIKSFIIKSLLLSNLSKHKEQNFT